MSSAIYKMFEDKRVITCPNPHNLNYVISSFKPFLPQEPNLSIKNDLGFHLLSVKKISDNSAETFDPGVRAMSQDRSRPYTDAGVDINIGNALVKRLKALVDSTHTRGVVSDLGGFGGLFHPDFSSMRDPLLVASTDGVGTKLKLAFLFRKYAGTGIDLVAMSVNDILVQGAMPLFFLDYFACGKLDPEICLQVVEGIADGCRQAQCALIGGETAEMPDMYPPGEYDLAGFCVGMVDNKALVDGSTIQPGDAIIGIASSGIHSNGYSLVRKILASTGLKGDDPFPGETGKTVAEVLMAPTTIYVSCVKPLFRDLSIKGMSHITGGGFYDNIPRVLPTSITAEIRFGSWSIPPVFQWLKKNGSLDWPQMLQIFNCGIGFVIILPDSQAEEAINRIKAFQLDAWKIGETKLRAKNSAGDYNEQVEIVFS